MVAEAFSEIVIPYPISNRVAYVVAQEEGVPLSEVKTRSGKEAQAEFGVFFEWLYSKVSEVE